MDLSDWTPPSLPPRVAIPGRYATLEPLDRAHIPGLLDAFGEDEAGAMWQYLPLEPVDEARYTTWVDAARASTDPMHFAVRMENDQLGGTLSLMRITPSVGSVETGWLTFAPRLQRTREATEAVFLLMQWAFEAGYRRFEWKCDAANLPSRRAAERFGFSYEGIFRQASIVKGRNRDTAWFACIDGEWPQLRNAFQTWLSPDNFDQAGEQKQRLGDLTSHILAARDPGR